MKSRWSVVALLGVAVVRVLAASAFQPPSSPPASNSLYRDFILRPLAEQLPQGFVLPQSDANLGVSALAFEDFDNDGDIDIVAAERDAVADFSIGTVDGSTTPVGIIVWVNDGTGLLTRKIPTPSNTLGRLPTSSSLDEHERPAAASSQPNAPASESSLTNGWPATVEQPYHLAVLAVLASATLGTLRSRSPPLLP